MFYIIPSQWVLIKSFIFNKLQFSFQLKSSATLISVKSVTFFSNRNFPGISDSTPVIDKVKSIYDLIGPAVSNVDAR